MKLELKALYEPLTVQIGDAVVETAIDVTAENLIHISEVCTTAKKEMDGVSTMQKKAKKDRDAKLLRKMNDKAAEIMEPAIVAAIGQQGYDDIVKACGAGREISKASCNVVMMRVLLAVMETIAEQQKNVIDEKAAHYLAEADNAQPILNAAI